MLKSRSIRVRVAATLLLGCSLLAAIVSVQRSKAEAPGGTAYPLADVLITLARGPCEGSCPVYRVEIRGTGEVHYRGFGYVAEAGERAGKIEVQRVVALVNAFLAARFFDALPKYDEIDQVLLEGTSLVPVTERTWDDPTATLTLRLGERVKSVELHNNYPVELERLASLIDEVAEAKQWVGQSR